MNVYFVTLSTTKSSEVKTVTVQANTEAGAMGKAVAQHPGWMASSRTAACDRRCPLDSR